MTNKLSIDVLPPSASDAFQIGVQVSTLAWHYCQAVILADREKHLEDAQSCILRIRTLCEKRGAIAPNHEVEIAINYLANWPKHMYEQFFAEDLMNLYAAWDRSRKDDSALLILAEGLKDMVPDVEWKLDLVIRNKILQHCPQSLKAYDFGKLLDAGRHSRRIPESLLIYRISSEADSRHPLNDAPDIHSTDDNSMAQHIVNADTLATNENLAMTSGSRQLAPTSPAPGTTQFPVRRRSIVHEVAAARPRAGETMPEEQWWAQLKALGQLLELPTAIFIKGEPDHAQGRREAVETIIAETISSLESVRTEYGSWKFTHGEFQYRDGMPFRMPRQQTALLAELLRHQVPLSCERLTKHIKSNGDPIKALNSSITRLRNELKKHLGQQLGTKLPADPIVCDRRPVETCYTLAPQIR